MTAPETDARAPAPDALSRRGALGLVAGLGTLFGSALGLVAGFVSNALGRVSPRAWIRLAPAEDLSVETYQRYVVAQEHRHAWQSERVRSVVYVQDHYPDDPVALLSTCSHLGCTVAWNAEEGQFQCPCHGGVYDASGAVVSGPPPRPLTRLEVKVEDDVCYVRWPDPNAPEAS